MNGREPHWKRKKEWRDVERKEEREWRLMKKTFDGRVCVEKGKTEKGMKKALCEMSIKEEI